MDAPTNILAFWRLVEWLTPASFPAVKADRHEDEPVYDIRPHESLPWDIEHPHRRHRCESKEPGKTSDNSREGWAYGVYAGLLDINSARVEIESWVGESADHVVRDERTPQGTSAIGFQVDGNGRVIAGTLVVSSFAWAYGTLRRHATDVERTLRADMLTTEAFAEAETEITERFSSELSGIQLTNQNCDEFLSWLFERLCLPQDALELRRCRVQCVRRPYRVAAPKSSSESAELPAPEDDEARATEQASPRLTRAIEMLNSYYLDDLALAHNAAADNNIGPALRQYLGRSPVSHLDVRKNLGEAWALMSPELYPKGRWPSKGRYPLVFSQQLAVNHAFRSIGDADGGLMAVNGPPGTGKTTLLKDVVAGVIVARAEILADFKSPEKAFDSLQPAWQSGHWNQHYAPIDNRIRRFGIVVASSNNGAVENVTLEFPKIEDVDPEWGDRSHSPFAELASVLLGKEESAWSLLSACLGNGQNRAEFVDVMWGWERKDEPGHARLATLLKGDRPAGVKSWRQAVKHFNEALCHEEECRKKRVKIYKQATKMGPLELELRKNRERIATLKVEVRQGLTELEALKEALEKATAAYDMARSERVASWEAKLQRAQSELAICQTESETVAIDLEQTQQSLNTHRQREPGALLCLLSDWVKPLESVTHWRSTEQALTERVAKKQSEEGPLRQRLAEAMKDVAKIQHALSPEALNDELSQEYHDKSDCLARKSKAEAKLRPLVTELKSLTRGLQALETKFQAAQKDVIEYRDWAGAAHCLMPSLLIGPAEDKELSSPWGDKEWEAARVAVFLAALDLHESFVFEASKPLLHNLRGMMQLLRGKAPGDLPEGVAATMWASLFLIVPLVSTTFASFSRQFAELGREDIGWLMIDEAGQAAPQQAAGALWRAKSALVVGDPLQLEPVVTVPDRLQATLAESCNVSMKWLPSNTSTQALADQASSHGSKIGDTWVGAPLLVHRRCDSPMFDISNEVAYDNAMVHGKPPSKSTLPASAWLHVEAGNANGHWIPAEGEVVKSLVKQMNELGVSPEDIFLISPFTTVVQRLRQIAYQLPGLKAGTIHTVQGKEARVVILVLGGDPARAGAKAWASSTPNLLNVAVSRAKERVYVVADRDAWERYPYFQACSEMLPDVVEKLEAN